MLVRTLNDVIGTDGEEHGRKRHSMCLIRAEDGLGVSLTDSILEAGFETTLGGGKSGEICYCLEGSGTAEKLPSGTIQPIRPGTLFAAVGIDKYRIRIAERTRLIRVFIPVRAKDDTDRRRD